MTIPGWAESIFPEPMRSVAMLGLTFNAYTHEMQRLNAGKCKAAIKASAKLHTPIPCAKCFVRHLSPEFSFFCK